MRPRPDWHQELSKALQQDFTEMKLRNSRCSLRSYARHIKTPVSTVSEILRGKVPVSAARAVSIVENLKARPRQKLRLLALLGSPVPVARQQLGAFQSLVLTDWVYLAVLHSLEIKSVRRNPACLPGRLGVPAKKVDAVITGLLTAKLLRKNDAGELEPTGENWQTSDGPSSDVIKKYHRDGLRLASESLELPAAERDFSSCIFPISTANLPALRTEIREFQRRLCALAEGTPELNRVYRVSVQLFPLDTGGDA